MCGGGWEKLMAECFPTTRGESRRDTWEQGYSIQGNIHWMPKLSASVKISLVSPDHCLLILPTDWVPSAERTWSVIKTHNWQWSGVPYTSLLQLQEAFPLGMYYLLVTTWYGNVLLGITRHILLLQARKAEAIDFHPL